MRSQGYTMELSNSTLQKIENDAFTRRGIELYVKRDDLIHPFISGNKWRKLKYNIALCHQRKNQGILTFGGAYSNHLLATASACELEGLTSIGIVRGEELNVQSNETLRKCASMGMQLIFVSREEYRMRHDKAYHESLSYAHPNYFVVPEGGANYYGMIGCQELVQEVNIVPDHWFVAQGTTTTSCGLLMGLNATQQLHVVPVLKGFQAISEMRNLFSRSGIEMEWVEEVLKQVAVHDTYHFGGYGSYTAELLEFIREFYIRYGIPLDPIYTGKAMFALMEEVKKTMYNNTRIVFLHTGGIQGSKSVELEAGVELYPTSGVE